MEALTVFLNDKYRPESCCCCFSLKVGTNMIGILDICWILAKLILPNGLSVIENKDSSTVTFFRGESDVTMVITTMFRLIFLISAAAMVFGNQKGDKGLMVPFVYLKFIGLIIVIVTDIVMLPLVFFFLAKFPEGLAVFVVAIVCIVLETYYWQVVQCRILELKETARPEAFFTHTDPDTAVRNVRDSSGVSAGISLSADVGSRILH